MMSIFNRIQSVRRHPTLISSRTPRTAWRVSTAMATFIIIMRIARGHCTINDQSTHVDNLIEVGVMVLQ